MWVLGRTWLKSIHCRKRIIQVRAAGPPNARGRCDTLRAAPGHSGVAAPPWAPGAKWAGTTAPRSQGALRPAAPGAGGYKWSGGCSSRLSLPRVAAVSVAFGLSKPEAEKRKSLKKIQKPQKPLKKKEKKKRGKKKAKGKNRRKRTRQRLVLGARGEVTFTASGLPVRLRLSVRPVVSHPPPSARPAPARLCAAWQPRAPAGRTTCPRCPSPAPAKIWFPPSRAAVTVNRREPGAYIYRETRVPKAALSAAPDCLLKEILPPLRGDFLL